MNEPPWIEELLREIEMQLLVYGDFRVVIDMPRQHGRSAIRWTFTPPKENQ